MLLNDVWLSSFFFSIKKYADVRVHKAKMNNAYDDDVDNVTDDFRTISSCNLLQQLLLYSRRL